jgi:hypothetical protein
MPAPLFIEGARMAGITLTQAQAQLICISPPRQKVLTGQSYEIAGRKLTRANLGRSRPASRSGTSACAT